MPPPQRWRHALAAAVALFGLLGGHTVLEVARDSLFLRRLPAEQLPLTYLSIAAVATLAAQFDAHILRRADDRRALSLTLLTGAAGALLFHHLFETEASWVPHAFYVWTGTIATLAVAQFWRLLSEVFTVVEAKRVYAQIGAGGAVGAMAGAAGAEALLWWIEPHGLLWAGAAIFAVTSLVPALLPASETTREPPIEQGEHSAAPVHRYARGLLALVAVTAGTATLVDYAFKSTVDTEIPSAELGAFFSRFYLGLNLASLLVQVLVAPRLLRSLGVARSLLVLPALLTIAGLTAFATGGVAAAVVLRGTDGGLRQSLHRSATEVLYFPLGARARKKYKASIDAFGQRAGQALGSVAILGAMLIGIEVRSLAIVVAMLGSVSAALVWWLRGGYLTLLRASLRAGSVEARHEVTQLDLSSLESMLASLNSERDEEVLTTLDLLEAHERARLVPALLLYHPSEPVVLRALELLAATDRTDYLEVARRLLDHPNAELSSMAAGAIASHLTPTALREELARGPRPGRAAVLVTLVGRGLDHDGAARREIETSIGHGDHALRMSLARAVRARRDPQLAWVLHGMVARADVALRRELARALGAVRDPAAVGTLIHWLGPRGAREEARMALVQIGEPAVDALRNALVDAELPRVVRAHVPRTLAHFVEPRAARILFDQLEHEPDGWLRYKLLRALRTLRESLPGLRFERERIDAIVLTTLRRAMHVLAQRIAVRDAHAADPSLRTAGSALLPPVLREKEEQAIDRAVRVVALASPDERLVGIVHALKSGDRRLRAEGGELLANLAEVRSGAALAALLEDVSDDDRLAHARDALGHPEARAGGYLALLAELIDDESDAVRCIAAHHAGELGARSLQPSLHEALRRAEGLSREAVLRALEALGAEGDA